MKQKSRALNLAIWLAIALLTVLIALATVWAAHQPSVSSMWAPD